MWNASGADKRRLKLSETISADASLCEGDVAREYRRLLMDGVAERITHGIDRQGQAVTKTLRKGASKAQAAAEKAHDGEIPFGKMLRCRVRYFSAGAVIGSREFVNEAFANAPERFGAKRKDGARKLKGAASPASGLLWSLRDLKTEPAPAG